MASTIDILDDDEETTVPPPPEEEPRDPPPAIPFAAGDFRTHETTLATRAASYTLEVALMSTQGRVAHFAVDTDLGRRLAAALGEILSQPDRRYTHTGSPRIPAMTPLDASGTDVFFTVEDEPLLRVEQEPDGDRIVLVLSSAEASVHLTMHRGVALGLQQFFAGGTGAHS